MSKAAATTHEAVLAADQSKSLLGFWIYLMTDCVLFASLFAIYAILHNNTVGGEGARELFHLPFVLIETLVLLTSSYTCGLAILAARRKDKDVVLPWLAVTFVLGAIFLIMEVTEFGNLVREGNSWRRSGFLSSYFTLVATHGLHITVGLMWIVALCAKIWKQGLNHSSVKRLMLFSMFWHFLDIIWIFIFSIVYLMGAL
jgi:cytochrome o ubiquinol oxidase subunit 3